MAAVYANSANTSAILKELYIDNSDYLKDLVYAKNPLLALLPKNESEDGMAGKYLPVPLEYGNPQGRSHAFASAQSQQTAASVSSFFVTIVQDYQLVTITNLLMEQSKGSPAAFVDAFKLQMDGGMRNITNNLAFQLFNDGTGSRGFIGSGATNPSGSTYVIPLSNAQQIVQFEVGMTLVNFTKSATTISSISSSTAVIQSVDRGSGVITVLASAVDASWLSAGKALGVSGDIVAGAISTANNLGLSGLASWLPSTAPSSGDNFFGVDRSADVTRLAGIRYDATAYTIEEGITNALALLNREGGSPDLIVMDFASYASLVNALGAKVMNIQIKHDEVEVAFDAISFQSAYGRVSVLADRSCPPATAFVLSMKTWKLRSLGRVPKVLTYGVEGLEGLRVGNADALEVRIGWYAQLICSAPGWNMIVSLSS